MAGPVVDVALLALARADPRARSARRGVHPLPSDRPRHDAGDDGCAASVAGDLPGASRHDARALMTGGLGRGERARI